MLPATNRRVACHTKEAINQQIAEETRQRVAHLATQGPEQITRRLSELDYEWDIERALETNAATFALSGVILGATVDRRWLLLPGLVTGFLLQHALQGWCPPLPLLRRMGFRTSAEINEERYALKALRGDFAQVAFRNGEYPNPQHALAAAGQ